MPAISSPESFEIEAADGGPLRLDLYPADAGARGPGFPKRPGLAPEESRERSLTPVVLFHGFRGYKNWGFIPLLASRLAEEGFPAVAFSASGSGVAGADGAFTEPERFRRNTYGGELDDLARVVEWSLGRVGSGIAARPGGPDSTPRLGRPGPRAGLVGHSRGGTLALLYAASDPRIRCVVTLAAQSQPGIWKPDQIAAWERGEDVGIYDFRTRRTLRLGPEMWEEYRRNRARYDVARAMGSLSAPLLVLHGDRDAVVAPENAREIASNASSVATELRIIAGAGHSFQAGDTIRRTPPQLLDVIEAVTAWVKRWLPAR